MSVRKAAVWAISVQYVAFAIQFVASVVLARYFIDPEELGIFSIAFVAVTLVTFLQDFGIGRYISGEEELTEDKRRTAFSISLTVGWLLALVALGLAWPLAAFYNEPRLVDISLVIAAAYFIVPFAIVPEALRLREMDYKSNALIGMASASANAATALALAWLGYGALALAWGAFAQQGARALVAQWRAGWMLPWPLRYANPRDVLSFGGTNTVLVLCTVIMTRAPELLIGRVLGAAPVGLFARATGLALQLRQLLSGALGHVLYPAFRQVRDRGDPLGPPYLRVLSVWCAITWPAMAGLAVLALPVVNLLYGDKWLDAAPLLVWIALSQMCFVAAPLNSDLPILMGHKRELVRRNVVDTVIALALLAISAPFGIEAVAMSRLVHGVFWLANFTWLLHKVVGFGWGEWLVTQAKSLLAAAMAAMPTLVLYSIWSPPQSAGFVQILASAAAGGVCWLATLAVLRHPAIEEILRFAAQLPLPGKLRAVLAR